MRREVYERRVAAFHYEPVLRIHKILSGVDMLSQLIHSLLLYAP